MCRMKWKGSRVNVGKRKCYQRPSAKLLSCSRNKLSEMCFSFLIGNFYFFLNVRMREFEALKVMKKWNGIAAVNCHQRKVCLWKRCEHFCKDIEDELFEWCWKHSFHFLCFLSTRTTFLDPKTFMANLSLNCYLTS